MGGLITCMMLSIVNEFVVLLSKLYLREGLVRYQVLPSGENVA